MLRSSGNSSIWWQRSALGCSSPASHHPGQHPQAPAPSPGPCWMSPPRGDLLQAPGRSAKALAQPPPNPGL